VIAISDLFALDLHDGSADAVEHEGNGAGRIGFEGQAGQVVHDLDLVHVLCRAGGIDRGGGFHYRPGLSFPAFGFLETVFEVADAGEVLVHAAAVAGAEVALQVLRLIGDGVEDALSGIEFSDTGVDFLGSTLKKKLLEDT